MHDDSTDTVTEGGPTAPLGACGEGSAARRGGAPRSDEQPTAPSPSDDWLAAASPSVQVALLAAALAAFAAIGAAVVDGSRLVGLDVDVASWVARSMPSWAEWLARPPTWLGGFVGTTLVVGAATVWLLRRGAARHAALLVAAAVGSHVFVLTAKELFGRRRPDVGSAVELPSSFSFPSGHATSGIVVFGLLGLLAASRAGTAAVRRAAVLGGIALGVAIGASRVVLNVHYVSDVLAGWCLGVACVAAALLVDRAWRR